MNDNFTVVVFSPECVKICDNVSRARNAPHTELASMTTWLESATVSVSIRK